MGIPPQLFQSDQPQYQGDTYAPGSDVSSNIGPAAGIERPQPEQSRGGLVKRLLTNFVSGMGQTLQLESGVPQFQLQQQMKEQQGQLYAAHANFYNARGDAERADMEPVTLPAGMASDLGLPPNTKLPRGQFNQLIVHYATNANKFVAPPSPEVQAFSYLTQNGHNPAEAYAMTKSLGSQKTENRDDRAIAILSKPQSSWTPEEKAYVGGWRQYVKETKTEPGVLRMAELNRGKVVPISDGKGGLIYVQSVDAPGNIAPADPRQATYAGYAKQVQPTLTAFNTVEQHLQALEQAHAALKNGNVQALNSIANRYGAAIGADAPTTFGTILNVVAPEVVKAAGSSGALAEGEINQVRNSFKQGMSENQLQGSTGAVRTLIHGKRAAIQQRLQGLQQGDIGGFDTPAASAPLGGSLDLSKYEKH